MNETTPTPATNLRLLAISLAAPLLASQSLQADQELEWQPNEGYHEEEWYDPSDWFNDDNQVDAEYGYTGYNYYDGAWDGYTWYPNYNYDYDFVDDTEYAWNDATSSWDEQSWDADSEYSAKHQFDEDQKGERQDQGNRNRSGSAEQIQASNDQRGAETLTGTVEAFRKIEVVTSTGLQETHALARISLANGETVAVDLGLESLLTSELRSGSEVTFHGTAGKIGGKKVFAASEMMTSNGETAYIDRSLPMPGDSSQGQRNKQASRSSSNQKQGRSDPSQSEEEQLVLEGRIAEKEWVQLKGDSERQTVIKIELQDGIAASVKLGPEKSLADLDLQQGDRISVRGHREKVDGKNIIVAQSIRVDGK